MKQMLYKRYFVIRKMENLEMDQRQKDAKTTYFPRSSYLLLRNEKKKGKKKEKEKKNDFFEMKKMRSRAI